MSTVDPLAIPRGEDGASPSISEVGQLDIYRYIQVCIWYGQRQFRLRNFRVRVEQSTVAT